MSTTKRYAQLEARIYKGDGEATEARWEFGRMLLTVRGNQKQLPHGFAAKLYKNLDTHVQVSLSAYQKELSRRMQFAEQYPTKAKVRVAFKKYVSWSAICASGLGRPGGQRPMTVPDVDAAADDLSVKRYRAWAMDPRNSTFPFVRQYYAVLGRIRAVIRPHGVPWRILWLTALHHGIEQEIDALERHSRRADSGVGRDPGLLKFVIAENEATVAVM